MLNKDGQRELAYVVKIDDIEPIIGSDNCESASVGGWHIMVRKETFKKGDLAIYFEIDSHLDINRPEFAFLASKKGNVKTQRYTFGGKGNFISQGLLMHPSDFGWCVTQLYDADFTEPHQYITNGDKTYALGDFLTKELGVKHIEPEGETRRTRAPLDRVKLAAQRFPNLFKHQFIRKLVKTKFGKKILGLLFGHRKKQRKADWPVGKFPGVSKTDQERVENCPDVLNENHEWIVTEKCDGSSATYILEKKHGRRYEFYVCSRNVRVFDEKQGGYYDQNYYWEVAKKYDIYEKMKEYINTDSKLKWVCWQGEICAPGIQKNPHHLNETHLFCFHWTDNINGRLDMFTASQRWHTFNMEVVPIKGTATLPKDLEALKLEADGLYDPTVCEGKADCPREGFVYYSVENPTHSFKNVSREYLLKH